MANEVKMNGRFIQKHDIEENWNIAARAANPFIPKQGEFIVYDDRFTDDEGEHIVADTVRYKIGDGIHNVEELAFITDLNSTQVFHQNESLFNIINNYILNIDYKDLEFDTSEIIFGESTAILGQAILGQLVLA